ncbi:FIST signal transduction protein [Desulforhopalus sp. IMCC35007]|uniref:FIST signal transduction protein n=1 Tax=Desulforhopalus sp. IMCC35007 TaxID=2569543 RepID=UPI0010ADEC36|nr:FIST N-terminal domain-containing protein [Desulforhopalus sp. IMCC35007]TKB07641.1 hypothetical protein FCL48_16565 [Desulforhopalus sp. IMCC35007]
MKVGIGHNNEEDAFASGVKIAQQALRDGAITNATFSLAFCHGNVNAKELLQGIRSVLGTKTPVLGGSAIGFITNHSISYEGYPAGIVVIEDEDMQIQVAATGGLDHGEKTVGRDLVRQLSVEKDDTLLLFYDSIQQPPADNSPPVLNSSTPLLKGIENELPFNIPIIGAGTVADFNFSPSIQFIGDDVNSQHAAALLIRGNFSVDVQIMHGCSPKDGIYHTITKIEGSIIYEIDNLPAVEVINDIYGDEEWQKQLPVKRLTIGVNHGEKFWDHFAEQNYVNRLITGVLPDKSGIVIFEADFDKGTEFQFMLRDPIKMLESAKSNTESLMQDIKKSGKTPQWAFYIDCAGRSALFSEILMEEAAEVQEVLNRNNIPLFGFYSGVEIAPFNNKNRGLDWTGVLAVFSI